MLGINNSLFSALSLPFPTCSHVLMHLMQRTFENIMSKQEIAHNEQLLLSTLFNDDCLFYCSFSRFQHCFSYITATVHFIHDPWVNKPVTTRLGNVPCPRALHHDRHTRTGDRAWDTRFQIPAGNHSTTGYSFQ